MAHPDINKKYIIQYNGCTYIEVQVIELQEKSVTAKVLKDALNERARVEYKKNQVAVFPLFTFYKALEIKSRQQRKDELDDIIRRM